MGCRQFDVVIEISETVNCETCLFNILLYLFTHLHRITFVGKGTKKMHERHWKDMPATAKTSMQSVVEKMTASSFRSRVKELQQKQHCKKRETEPQRGS